MVNEAKLIRRKRKRSEPIVVTKRGLELIETMAAIGQPIATIARSLGINPVTFRQLRKRDPKVHEAYEVGRAIEEDQLFKKLKDAAEGGSIASAMFLLKTRHGYRETGPREGEEVQPHTADSPDVQRAAHSPATSGKS